MLGGRGFFDVLGIDMSLAECKFEVVSELSDAEQINNLHEELMSVGKTAIEKAFELVIY